MAGGLYWTASVGLLTLSALKAYPVMIAAGGAAIAVIVLGTTFWTSRSPAPGAIAQFPAADLHSPCTSTYDSVTGLPTTRLFTSLLTQALERTRNKTHQVAVLLVEMDHFTLTADLDALVNRNLVYRVQAARIKSALRTTDCVARVAERTFAVIVDHVTRHEEVVTAANKMLAALSLPFILDSHEVFLTSRIGISLSTFEHSEGAALIKSATRALATARAEGCAFYGLQGALVPHQPQSSGTLAA